MTNEILEEYGLKVEKMILGDCDCGGERLNKVFLW